MKFITSLLMILASFNFVFAQMEFEKNAFILKGKIESRTSSLIHIEYLDENEQYVYDSCKVKKGEFLFKGFINGGTAANIYKKENTSSTEKLNMISFYLDPTIMEIWINGTEFKIKGSKTQNEKDELEDLKNAIYEELSFIVKKQDSIRILIKKIGSSPDLINKQKILEDKRIANKEEEKNIDYSFMRVNPKSFLNPQLLSYYFGSKKLSLDSTLILFHQFDMLVQKSIKGKMLMREIDGKRNSATGQIAPLFVREDINGNEISLSSFRDKNYVLLDFWASWCVPCRKFTPTMKSYYEKYHPKGLEIVSISWDSKPEAWKEAIKKDGMDGWKNIRSYANLPDYIMRDKYGIPSIPLLILIDKNGVIIGRYMAPKEDGGQAELEKKLEEIFNKP